MNSKNEVEIFYIQEEESRSYIKDVQKVFDDTDSFLKMLDFMNETSIPSEIYAHTKFLVDNKVGLYAYLMSQDEFYKWYIDFCESQAMTYYM